MIPRNFFDPCDLDPCTVLFPTASSHLVHHFAETNRADAAVTSLTASQRGRLRDALLTAMNAELETVAFRLVCAEDDYDGSTEWLILVGRFVRNLP